MLQASLDVAVFPEPILSSAGVDQRLLDFVVAQRLPSAVHEDSVRYVNHVLVCLVSTLLVSLPLPKCLADLQELDLLLERIAITVTICVGVKIAHLLRVRVAELAPARCNGVLHYFLPQYGQSFASQPLHIDEWQQEVLLVDGVEHVEPFVAAGCRTCENFVPSSSCVKSTVGTNLAPLVSISMFIVLIETLALGLSPVLV